MPITNNNLSPQPAAKQKNGTRDLIRRTATAELGVKSDAQINQQINQQKPAKPLSDALQSVVAFRTEAQLGNSRNL